LYPRIGNFIPRDFSLAWLHCPALAAVRRLSGSVSVAFVYSVETAKDSPIVATECEYETVHKLSNGTIFNDPE